MPCFSNRQPKMQQSMLRRSRALGTMPSTGFVKRGVAFRTTPTRVVVMRSENNSKMVREYREDDDKIVVPEESSSQAPGAPQGALYADEVPPAVCAVCLMSSSRSQFMSTPQPDSVFSCWCGTCGVSQHYSSFLQMAKPKDNMSKEMKARLRKEYVGLGGAENAVSTSCCMNVIQNI